MKTFKSFIVEGRPSQQHALEGHDYHKKTDNELRYVMKDAGEAAKAMRGHNEKAENKYMDQVNDASTVLHFRKTHGMPDWYKKKYGHIKEEVSLDLVEGRTKDPDYYDKEFHRHHAKVKGTMEKLRSLGHHVLGAAHYGATDWRTSGDEPQSSVVDYKDKTTGKTKSIVVGYNPKKGLAESSSAPKYKVKSIGTDKNGDYYISPNTGKKVYKKVKVGAHETPSGEIKNEEVEQIEEVAAWQRKEGKNPEGGLNRKGIESYRREHPGSKLSMAVTTKPSKLKKGSKAAKRRKSFCARMSGMKRRLTSAKTANDPNSRINKSLRKWNC